MAGIEKVRTRLICHKQEGRPPAAPCGVRGPLSVRLPLGGAARGQELCSALAGPRSTAVLWPRVHQGDDRARAAVQCRPGRAGAGRPAPPPRRPRQHTPWALWAQESPLHILLLSLLLFFFKFILFNLFSFWLRWVFVAARGLSLVAVSKGYSSLWCAGFSLRWLILSRSTGSRRAGFSSCGMQAQ